MVPAAASLVTTASSTAGTKSAKTVEPNVVRTPAVLLRSLIAVGTPSSGGRSPPAARNRSGRPLGAAGGVERPLGCHRDEGAQCGVPAGDARERVLDQLGGRHLARADRSG